MARLKTFSDLTPQEQYEALTSQVNELTKKRDLQIAADNSLGGGWVRRGNSYDLTLNPQINALNQQRSKIQSTINAAKPNEADVAWQTAMDLLQKQGPYTPEVTQQLINRRADQSAAAEATNVEELRNLAAARGIDPTQAIRQAQAQRQQQNIAFQGDIASKAAVENFSAETPGRMAAANAYLNRQFAESRAPAVTSQPLAFSGSSTASQGPLIPQPVQQQSMAFGPSKLVGGGTAKPAPAAKPVVAQTQAQGQPKAYIPPGAAKPDEGIMQGARNLTSPYFNTTDQKLGIYPNYAMQTPQTVYGGKSPNLVQQYRTAF